MTVLMASVFSFAPSYSQTPSDGRMIKIVPIVTLVDPDRTVPKQKQGVFSYIFEACAGPTTIKLPVITVTSDKQNLKVKLGDKISANSCQMTSVKIEASDKDSIAVQPAGNAGSSTKASDLELKIISLQQELNQEKQELKTLTHNPARPADFVGQLDGHVLKITELRKMITEAKAEFNKILYLTYN